MSELFGGKRGRGGRPAGEAPGLGAKKKRAPKDPVEAAIKDNSEDRKHLILVTRGVTFSSFMDADPPLSVNTFNELRGAALIECFFFDLPDTDVASKLGVGADHLKKLRSHPHFPKMCEAIKASHRRLAAPKTMDAMAEEMEPEVARELYGLAILEKSPREKLKALGEFVDRRSAKKGREAEQRGMMFPENQMALMQAAMELAGKFEAAQRRRLLDAGIIDVKVHEIDASVLNVPAQEEE